jgi:4-hydroxythreonine-4-phosphate dehydrogenase
MQPAPLAVSLGDPAGIGPEIIALAWQDRARHALPVFACIGDRRSIAAVWPGPIQTIAHPADAAGCFADALPLLQVDDCGDIVPGEPNLAGARCALDSLELAVGLARSGAAGAVVTGPVAKSQLYAIGFSHPGQTEFVAERCGVATGNVAMMLVGPTLRTVPVTIHVPIDAVSASLTTDLIVSRARAAVRGLQRDFGIAAPRLAIAGLNPHAGEGGALGREDAEIIAPAVALLLADGIDARGPLAPDTMFHAAARQGYDAAICMYHDQALIPLKTLHFDEGVNLTLGLPIIRTSPDHGTAFDIAGHGRASPRAMIAAIALAGQCAARRVG